jgi:L-alanine-DL-glutamate epimerase-like enolase superfamily enzyme
MNTTDTLTLKALELKQTISGTNDVSDKIFEHLIDQNGEMVKEKLRNICAFISNELFADVEQLCNNLGLSKRSVIEMALIDIIAKAKKIMSDHDVFADADAKGE